ncbi:MAG: GNAT family N-acetyltransferase [Chloroflexota bacterium]
MLDMHIRPLRAEEVETLVAIAVAAWEPIFAMYRQTLGEELFALETPDWRAKKADQIRRGCAPDSRAAVFVAERAGKIVGFVTCYTHASGVGEIGNNAVWPAERGQGIAPRLYEHALAHLRAQGMGYVKVGTGLDPAHAPARRAYEKVGFEVAVPAVTYYRKL